MAAAHLSPLTIHVLNTGDGIPAARMALSLHRLDSKLMIWNMISVGTDEDGCCPGLIPHPDFLPGLYKLRFETGPYWESLGHISFYPYVEHLQKLRKLMFSCSLAPFTLNGTCRSRYTK
ncbi:5-hydroxyisourate hydrolase b isoform X3 [Takifugu rubripes]|nr:5-hydroxyisourate hydrolase-like isoform X3 [Takifugu rubripes]XP_029697790.1 5-hydroxyisourate hydrolase-like isoform X3 [Takifugu rubripes]XP_029697791.1 5-hydroxyisourate hydrolase-like isoform X3 [Takifugu rubripes]